MKEENYITEMELEPKTDLSMLILFLNLIELKNKILTIMNAQH